MHENDFAPGVIFCAPKIFMGRWSMHNFMHGIFIHENYWGKFSFTCLKWEKTIGHPNPESLVYSCMSLTSTLVFRRSNIGLSSSFIQATSLFCKNSIRIIFHTDSSSKIKIVLRNISFSFYTSVIAHPASLKTGTAVECTTRKSLAFTTNHSLEYSQHLN